MNAASFVISEDGFVCKECDETVPASESDSHAVRRHRAASIRIFNTERGYDTWVLEQAEIEKIRVGHDRR